MKKYPDVHYLGKKEGRELSHWYANADAFVFPSKTDTFGIVLLESISCGTPIVAYDDQPGPLEVIEQNVNGILCKKLEEGLQECLSINRMTVEQTSIKWSWKIALFNFYQK